MVHFTRHTHGVILVIGMYFWLSESLDPNEKPCSTNGGNCMIQSRCRRSSSLKSGWCPSQPGNVKCCVAYQETKCTNAGGTCQRSDMACGGSFRSRLCPTQAGNIECCIANKPDSSSEEVSVSGECSGASCTEEIPLPAYAHAQGHGVSSLPLKKLLKYYGNDICDRSSAWNTGKVRVEKLRTKMVMESIGPFGVTATRPFLALLRAAMSDIKVEKPNIYPLLTSNGGFNCRYVKGTRRWSNHAFGFALDLNVTDLTDPYNNGKTFRALAEIAPIMNKHGLFWGAGYSTSEDAMHFEVSEHMFDKWVKDDTL